MMLGLSTGVTIAWWVACGVLLVVAIVVWALLELLRRTVRDVDSGVQTVWTSGKRVAQNTWTAHLFLATKERAGDLLAELRHHASAAERSDR